MFEQIPGDKTGPGRADVIDPDGKRQPTALGEQEGPRRADINGAKPPYFIDEVRALSKRQPAEPVNLPWLVERPTYSIFKRGCLCSFLGGLEPDGEFDSGEELLIVRASIPWRTEGRLLHAPYGPQHHARRRLAAQHRRNPHPDVSVAIGLTD